MSLKKFGTNDVILNTMQAAPASKFLIFDGQIYYNSTPEQSGAFTTGALDTPSGYISLYEYNIDRADGTNDFIYPYILKDSANSSFKTVGATSYTNEFVYGDKITGSYPMSASITREYMITAGARATIINKESGLPAGDGAPTYPHFYALKNTLNYYGVRSQHFKVSSSYGDKNLQNVNLISIPSIFYSSRIEPGTVSLKWYFTGSLAGELRDTKRNGELIQCSGSDSTSNIGDVAGVILYEQGFILLTGSWDLNSESIPLISGSGAGVAPSWRFFGAGAQDGVTVDSTGPNFCSASFDLSFRGESQTQVLTMFAHARRGEVNYSNNPTYLQYDQSQMEFTSSTIYEENPARVILNTASSSFSDYSASFKRQVYVSRVAIYDENRNLMGIATLANPILKEEDEDLAFKIKLDI